MGFKSLAIITAILGFLLGAAYILAGGIIVGRWQIEPTVGVLLLAKRVGALYLGLSVMFFLARSEPLSRTRTALSSGAAVALSLLALSGVYELFLHHAGPGILASILLESLLALGYIRLLFSERKSFSKA
jgi:hypothetical protein